MLRPLLNSIFVMAGCIKIYSDVTFMCALQETALHYDSHTGTYYTYDSYSGTYIFHSQVDLSYVQPTQVETSSASYPDPAVNNITSTKKNKKRKNKTKKVIFVR